jgi:hypothetical protein
VRTQDSVMQRILFELCPIFMIIILEKYLHVQWMLIIKINILTLSGYRNRTVLGKEIRTLEIGNTWFATTFPSLHFSVFCQITEFCYGPGLMGHTVYKSIILIMFLFRYKIFRAGASSHTVKIFAQAQRFVHFPKKARFCLLNFTTKKALISAPYLCIKLRPLIIIHDWDLRL